MTPLLPERLVHVSAMFDKRFQEAFYLDGVFMGPAALAELDKQLDAEQCPNFIMAIKLRSLQGLLSGLISEGNFRGCLECICPPSFPATADPQAASPVTEPDCRRSCGSCSPPAVVDYYICQGCDRSHDKGQVPAEALINGTWQGLVPVELKGLNDIEVSMIGVYNAITIMGTLSGGTVLCVILIPIFFLLILRRWFREPM